MLGVLIDGEILFTYQLFKAITAKNHPRRQNIIPMPMQFMLTCSEMKYWEHLSAFVQKWEGLFTSIFIELKASRDLRHDGRLCKVSIMGRGGGESQNNKE